MLPTQTFIRSVSPYMANKLPEIIKLVCSFSWSRYCINTIWAGGPTGLFIGFHKVHPIINDSAFDVVLGVDSLLLGMMTGPVLVPSTIGYYTFKFFNVFNERIQ